MNLSLIITFNSEEAGLIAEILAKIGLQGSVSLVETNDLVAPQEEEATNPPQERREVPVLSFEDIAHSQVIGKGNVPFIVVDNLQKPLWYYNTRGERKPIHIPSHRKKAGKNTVYYIGAGGMPQPLPNAATMPRISIAQMRDLERIKAEKQG